ncbi:LysR family transcriptional regulator [Neomicrococcus lactis]
MSPVDPGFESPGGSPNADDLLVLRAVAKTGYFSEAAHELGLNHTTVSRRITALEKSLGAHVLVRTSSGWRLTDLGRRAVVAADSVASAVSALTSETQTSRGISGVVRLSATDGISAYIIAPAVAKLRETNPDLNVEIVATTRRASQIRTGLDMEIVVGEPQVQRAEVIELGEYELGLFASREWVAANKAPTSLEEVLRSPLVYFIDSMLQVDDLDTPRKILPGMRDSVTSTNVFVHVYATRASAGIGFLPVFMAAEHADLVRLLPSTRQRLTYWLVVRPENLQQLAVAAVVRAIRDAVSLAQPFLVGEGPNPFLGAPSEGLS